MVMDTEPVMRTMPSHTKGKWVNDSKLFSGGWRCIVNLPGDRCIDVADTTNRETDEEDYANAQLIATAPKLLAACKAAIKAIENAQHRPRNDPPHLKRLRAVVEEATSPVPGSVVWQEGYVDV